MCHLSCQLLGKVSLICIIPGAQSQQNPIAMACLRNHLLGTLLQISANPGICHIPNDLDLWFVALREKEEARQSEICRKEENDRDAYEKYVYGNSSLKKRQVHTISCWILDASWWSTFAWGGSVSHSVMLCLDINLAKLLDFSRKIIHCPPPCWCATIYGTQSPTW